MSTREDALECATVFLTISEHQRRADSEAAADTLENYVNADMARAVALLHVGAFITGAQARRSAGDDSPESEPESGMWALMPMWGSVDDLAPADQAAVRLLTAGANHDQDTVSAIIKARLAETGPDGLGEYVAALVHLFGVVADAAPEHTE